MHFTLAANVFTVKVAKQLRVAAQCDAQHFVRSAMTRLKLAFKTQIKHENRFKILNFEIEIGYIRYCCILFSILILNEILLKC